MRMAIDVPDIQFCPNISEDEVSRIQEEKGAPFCASSIRGSSSSEKNVFAHAYSGAARGDLLFCLSRESILPKILSFKRTSDYHRRPWLRVYVSLRKGSRSPPLWSQLFGVRGARAHFPDRQENTVCCGEYRPKEIRSAVRNSRGSPIPFRLRAEQHGLQKTGAAKMYAQRPFFFARIYAACSLPQITGSGFLLIPFPFWKSAWRSRFPCGAGRNWSLPTGNLCLSRGSCVLQDVITENAIHVPIYLLTWHSSVSNPWWRHFCHQWWRCACRAGSEGRIWRSLVRSHGWIRLTCRGSLCGSSHPLYLEERGKKVTDATRNGSAWKNQAAMHAAFADEKPEQFSLIRFCRPRSRSFLLLSSDILLYRAKRHKSACFFGLLRRRHAQGIRPFRLLALRPLFPVKRSTAPLSKSEKKKNTRRTIRLVFPIY